MFSSAYLNPVTVVFWKIGPPFPGNKRPSLRAQFKTGLLAFRRRRRRQGEREGVERGVFIDVDMLEARDFVRTQGDRGGVRTAILRTLTFRGGKAEGTAVRERECEEERYIDPARCGVGS